TRLTYPLPTACGKANLLAPKREIEFLGILSSKPFGFSHRVPPRVYQMFSREHAGSARTTSETFLLASRKYISFRDFRTGDKGQFRELAHRQWTIWKTRKADVEIARVAAPDRRFPVLLGFGGVPITLPILSGFSTTSARSCPRT